MSKMIFEEYGTKDGPKICATLQAMLSESGEHIFRLAFGAESQATRNCIFGVVVIQTTKAPENCGWDSGETQEGLVYLCYELCDAFPLYPQGAEFHDLQQSIKRILDVNVVLLPFTTFQRTIGIYHPLCEIFRRGKFSSLFRYEAGSLLDTKMHVVLSRLQDETLLFQCKPPTSCGTSLTSPDTCDDWNIYFRSLACVLWYHDYVYKIIGEDVGDGFSESNVFRTYDAVSSKTGKDMQGKLALLDILKLVYRYNYSAT
jgi:hypothetical protein